MNPAPRLHGLADTLVRLRPNWNNPERYFENRQETERALRHLDLQMEQQQ